MLAGGGVQGGAVYGSSDKQAAYVKELGHLKLPLTEALHREVVSLPVSPVMTDEQVGVAIKTINQLMIQ